MAALSNTAGRLRRLVRWKRAGEGGASRPVDLLGEYTRPGKRRYRVIGGTVLAILAIFYGLVLGATGTIFLFELLLPLAAVVFLLVWLLPENDRPLPRTVEFLLFAYLVVCMVWPDYLAIAIPGLPWITLARLVALPLAFLYLASLSQSPTYRAEIKEVVGESPLVWKALLAFAVLAAFSVIVSDKPMESANRMFVALYAWVMIFFVAAQVFRRPDRAIWFSYLVWGCALIVCFITAWEVRKQELPWVGHIPGFLKVQDESVQRMLASKVRGSTGVFRAQSKFASPLSLAEFLVLTVPFVMHVIAYHRLFIVRVAAAASLFAIVWAILQTDARLGMVGVFISSLLFVLAWAAMRARERKDSLVAQVVLLGYPVGFVIVLAASLTITRFKNMIWGSSAYDDSNQARVDQMHMGLPMILKRPWGYGIGRSGERLGFTNSEGIITIDNYMLSIGLEVGIIGFIAFFGMFVAGIVNGAKQVPRQYDYETSLIVPAVITLVNFVTIKAVLSQMENQTLFFCVLGLTVALIYRLKQFGRSQAPAGNAVTPAGVLSPV